MQRIGRPMETRHGDGLGTRPVDSERGDEIQMRDRACQNEILSRSMRIAIVTDSRRQ